MAENRIGAPFKRKYSGPLEVDAVKYSYEDAVEFAKSRSAYAGEIISVVIESESRVDIYKVNVDRSLLPLESTIKQKIVPLRADVDSEQRFMVIEHKLDCRPVVIVTETDEDDNVINASVEVLVEYLDSNTVKISWNGELHGEVAISK